CLLSIVYGRLELQHEGGEPDHRLQPAVTLSYSAVASSSVSAASSSSSPASSSSSSSSSSTASTGAVSLTFFGFLCFFLCFSFTGAASTSCFFFFLCLTLLGLAFAGAEPEILYLPFLSDKVKPRSRPIRRIWMLIVVRIESCLRSG